jgi:hypothetical protein
MRVLIVLLDYNDNPAIRVHHPLTPSREGENIEKICGDTPRPGSIGMLHLPPPLMRRLKG